MGNERGQDKWLGVALRQSPAVASDACPDAETLAAWADGGLSAKATAAVELHASSCSRCMGVLAAMERSAPAVRPAHAWTPARLARWLVPVTAAATAVAFWVAVPDRGRVPVPVPVPSSVPVPVPVPEVPVPVPGAGSVPDSERRTSNAEPGTRNLEPRAREESQSRDQFAPQALGGAAVGTAAAPESAPPPASPAPAPIPPPAAAPATAAAPRAEPAEAPPSTALTADTFAETVGPTAQRSALAAKAVATSESIAPSNAQARWRVIGYSSIERSLNGGKTWARTSPPPGVAPNNTPALTIVGIRAVDGSRAVARTSDGADAYTTDGGRSWTRVQENSTAPF